MIGLTYANQEIVAGMMSGASAYLTSHAPRSDVVRTIRSNGNGEMFLVPEVAKRALWIAQIFRKFVDVGRMSERERQVLSMVVAGQSNAKIGNELGISPNTVRNHVSRILAKLKLTAKDELVDYATVIDVLNEEISFEQQ